MTNTDVTNICAIGTLLAFAYISESLERHTLSGHPRLSSLLLLAISAFVCFGVSHYSKWLPGGEGRFTNPERLSDSEWTLGARDRDETEKSSLALIPSRPKRYFFPVLIVCIVMRFELFNAVTNQQQCAATGVEVFLCPLLFTYEVFATRKKYGFPAASDPNDPWRTIFDDLYEWFSGPRVVMVLTGLSCFIFTLATFYSTGQIKQSTYFCFEPVDNRSLVLSMQLFGLIIDALIVILLWRLLSWTRTIKLRLRALASILALSSLFVGLIWVANIPFDKADHLAPGFGSLYGFDILVDSVAFAMLAIFSTTWIGETSLLLPASSLTIMIGFWASVENARRFGNWTHPDRGPILLPLWVLFLGCVLFLKSHGIYSLFYLRRILVILLLLILSVTVTIRVIIKEPPTYSRHPVSDLIYKANVEHDRWVTEASTSRSLKVALETYEERHGGRIPPPHFDQWYEHAKNTVVIDTFDQIDHDLNRFWEIKPELLRKRADLMSEVPGVSVITVKSGKVSYRGAEGDEHNINDLQELSDIIDRFAVFLPDMVLPINLGCAPRILPPWEEANDQGHADIDAVVDLISQRSELESANLTETAPSLGVRNTDIETSPISLRLPSTIEYRKMLSKACAPNSPARVQQNWDITEFCSHCVRRFSKHAFMTKWQRSLEICEQPDMMNLHEHFMKNPTSLPIRKLMPLFSVSKLDSYNDIIIPLPSAALGGEPDMKWDFKRRYDSLFWRGAVGSHEGENGVSLRGSQKYRLLNLFIDPNARDQVSVLLPRKDKKSAFGYERVSTRDASGVAPFDIGIGAFSECQGRHCELIKQRFGVKEDIQEPLEYRYVLQLDEEHGPPLQLMRTIRSGSVPFVSTIFRSWYSERLQPYLHFVPVDPRYHSLHSTYLYFTGTEGRAGINGRDTNFKGRPDDGEWIAREGRKWAEKAITEKDMEVYLFRLLLEWGRLIDEKREDIGFRLDEAGDKGSVDWTKQA